MLHQEPLDFPPLKVLDNLLLAFEERFKLDDQLARMLGIVRENDLRPADIAELTLLVGHGAGEIDGAGIAADHGVGPAHAVDRREQGRGLDETFGEACAQAAAGAESAEATAAETSNLFI